MSYNGWHNYETWNANLWMDENRSYWDEIATGICKITEDEDDATNELGDAMETSCEEQLEALQEHIGGANMFMDILNSGVHCINWREIAKHYVEAAKEELSEVEA